jgi:hypothetical protein
MKLGEVALFALSVMVFGSLDDSHDKGNEGRTKALAYDIASSVGTLEELRESLAPHCFINTTEQASPRLFADLRTL